MARPIAYIAGSQTPCPRTHSPRPAHPGAEIAFLVEPRSAEGRAPFDWVRAQKDAGRRVFALVPNPMVGTADPLWSPHRRPDPYLAILRALKSNVSAGGYEQGASTIEQQLVRNLYLSPQQSISRKLNEACLAVQLDKRDLLNQSVKERRQTDNSPAGEWLTKSSRFWDRRQPSPDAEAQARAAPGRAAWRSRAWPAPLRRRLVPPLARPTCA